jgi:hypothetical protein
MAGVSSASPRVRNPPSSMRQRAAGSHGSLHSTALLCRDDRDFRLPISVVTMATRVIDYMPAEGL